MLTPERLKQLIDYDPQTGTFTWKVNRRKKAMAGTIGGTHTYAGYRQIRLDGVLYRAHRLAWFYFHGEWPTSQMDHINGRRDDNRIANLRLATHSQNCANRGRQRHNKSGFKGVTWDSQAKKWRSVISARGKSFALGLHSTPEAAHAAYVDAAQKYHGEFARTE